MFIRRGNSKSFTEKIMREKPSAVAVIKGSPKYPDISGTVSFYSAVKGVLVVADINGLPYNEGKCKSKVFGFHIHEGGRCSGNAQQPFKDAGEHFNPYNCHHPRHAGDLPPLFGNNGYAWGAFLTDRFSVEMVMGRTVIIHSNPDDFTSQPSGNAGEMMACGVIKQY
ncbi:MAG: superoxide dismutase family protein [Christensenellales bacterium]|jgi:Cu-Zn family superoxide dismutase